MTDWDVKNLQDATANENEALRWRGRSILVLTQSDYMASENTACSA